MTVPAPRPRIIIIAGPNGAGKTTFAREFLPNEAACPMFVNADLIAAGLSPFAPDQAAVQAGRLMLAAIAQHVARRESFAFETTLSGRGYARHIPQWRESGYFVELFFLRLPHADMAVQRVAERVRQGGRHIPEATIRRRFVSGLELLHTVYQPLVDQWAVYDNAGDEPQLIDWSGKTMTTSHQVKEPMPAYEPGAKDTHADFKGAHAAIRRAAQRARLVAQQTGTDLIVVRAGQVVRVRSESGRPA
jgi:predicted ABC-type ATPase